MRWTDKCGDAFRSLKDAMMKDPVLTFLDISKPFEIHKDVLDFALGRVLLQEVHPMAFESRKLFKAERKYMAQEKELLAMIRCLRVWMRYLLESKFVVKIYNVVISHFLTQPKLSLK